MVAILVLVALTYVQFMIYVYLVEKGYNKGTAGVIAVLGFFISPIISFLIAFFMEDKTELKN